MFPVVRVSSPWPLSSGHRRLLQLRTVYSRLRVQQVSQNYHSIMLSVCYDNDGYTNSKWPMNDGGGIYSKMLAHVYVYMCARVFIL